MDALLPWLRRSGWVYVALAIAVALVAWRVAGGGGVVVQPQPAGETVGLPVAPAESEAAVVAEQGARRKRGPLVHVAGAVRRPGVYRLRAGARVHAAVRRAGGPSARADLTGLNLAARASDGQQILVPRRSPVVAGGGAAPSASGAPPAAAGPLSLSSATVDQLEGLDGIGPTLAARIAAWRDGAGPIRSVDRLMEVEGIGPGRLESLRPQVVP